MESFMAVAAKGVLEGVIGRSTAFSACLEKARKAAAADTTVLLCGESGTGKEVLAQNLHKASRRSGKFVAINCAAIPENLLESELFGHVKGAFTGADKDDEGLVRAALNGTLFLNRLTIEPVRDDTPHEWRLYALDKKTVIRTGYGIFRVPTAVGRMNSCQFWCSGFGLQPSYTTTNSGITPAFALDAGFPPNPVAPPPMRIISKLGSRRISPMQSAQADFVSLLRRIHSLGSSSAPGHYPTTTRGTASTVSAAQTRIRSRSGPRSVIAMAGISTSASLRCQDPGWAAPMLERAPIRP